MFGNRIFVQSCILPKWLDCVYIHLAYRKIELLYEELSEEDALCVETLNLLAPGLFFLILAHPVYKMWIIQEPNMLDLWNKLHCEEEKTESICHV